MIRVVGGGGGKEGAVIYLAVYGKQKIGAAGLMSLHVAATILYLMLFILKRLYSESEI